MNEDKIIKIKSKCSKNTGLLFKRLENLQNLSKNSDYYWNRRTQKTAKWFKNTKSKPDLWLDHIFWAINENLSDEPILINEPYSLGFKDVENLLKYCKERSLSIRFDGFSKHYPGRTFRIYIYRPKAGKKFTEDEIEYI